MFFLLPATKGSEAGGDRDPRARDPPRTVGGEAVSGTARLSGMRWGPCGEERAWRPSGPILTGGHRVPPLSLRGLPLFNWFSRGARRAAPSCCHDRNGTV